MLGEEGIGDQRSCSSTHFEEPLLIWINGGFAWTCPTGVLLTHSNQYARMMQEEGDPEQEQVSPHQTMESVSEDDVRQPITRRVCTKGDFTSAQPRESWLIRSSGLGSHPT